MINIRSLILAHVMVLSMMCAFSQTSTRTFTNEIEIRTNWYTFFRGGPIIQTKYTENKYWLSNGYCLSYTHKKATHSWTIALDYFAFANFTPVTKLASGAYWERNFTNVQFLYSRPILKNEKTLLTWQAGISLRGGYELIFAYYMPKGEFNGESIVLGKTLLDAGIIGGLNFQYFLHPRFSFNSKLAYTIYPYTFDKKNDSYNWDRGPTWQMMSLNFGVGFHFGKN